MLTALRLIRARLRREDGIVLVVVLGVLLVLGLISAAVLASAMSSKSQTAVDRYKKQAYGAAVAGLSAAVYQLNTSVPSDNACPPYPGLSTAPSVSSLNTCGPYESDNQSNQPGASTQKVTNGRYTYWVTPVLDSSVLADGTPGATYNDVCTGAPPRVAAGRKLVVEDRCITVVGQATANGDPSRILATRRIQARVSAGQILFPIPGLWGTACATIGANTNANSTGCQQPPTALSNSSFKGAIGSDGTTPPCAGCAGVNLSLAAWFDDPGTTSTTPANMYLGCVDPSCSGTATYDMKMKSNFAAGATSPAPSGCTGNSPNGAVHYCSGSTPPLPYSGNAPFYFGRYFALPRVGEFFARPPDPHFATTPPPSVGNPTGCASTTDVSTCNDNSKIAAAVTASGCSGTTYNSSTRTLVVGNNCTTMRIPDGTYDFCSVTLNRGSIILPASTAGTPSGSQAEIRVFIDSPSRPGAASACPNGTDGNFNVDQSGTAPVWMSNTPSNSASTCNSWNLDPWTALAGQIFVYGAGDPADPLTNFPVNVNHSVAVPGGFIFHGTLEAPNSTFNATGSNVCVNGGIAAGALNVANNMSYTWDPNVDTVFGSRSRTYYRTAWSMCDSTTGDWTGSPKYPSDPMARC